jgi:hypothetical protein
MSDTRTARTNFVQNARLLVQKFSPFLEYINERELLSSLFGGGQDGLERTVEGDESLIRPNSLTFSFTDDFLSFQSGALTTYDFYTNYLTSIFEDVDIEDKQGVIDVLTTNGIGLAYSENAVSNLQTTSDQTSTASDTSLRTSIDLRNILDEASRNFAKYSAESTFAIYYPIQNSPLNIYEPAANSLNVSYGILASSVTTNRTLEDQVDTDSRVIEARSALEQFLNENPETLDREQLRQRDRLQRELETVLTRTRDRLARNISSTTRTRNLEAFDLGINNNIESPNSYGESDSGPNIVSVLINDVNLVPGNRDTGITELFMNFIPPIEMSRAVPYLDISVCTRDTINGVARPKVTSLSEALGMEDNLTRNPNEISSLETGDATQFGNTNFGIATGIELFTAPQTMFDANNFKELDELAPNQIRNPIDRFRPPASFSGFNVDIVSAGAGMISHKSAKMKLTVHDRGRFSDFGHFVRPELYSSTHLLVEYGWSHPDNDIEVNPYGFLINTLRTTEKYTITNSSFTMGDSGEIEVNLDLFARGAEQMAYNDISRGEGVEPIIQQIDSAIREINNALNGLRATNSAEEIVDIFPSNILSAITSTDASITARSDELDRAISQFINSTQNNQNTNIQSIRTSLINIYGSGANDSSSLSSKLKNTIATSLERKHRMLNNNVDPFLVPESIRQINPSRRNQNLDTGEISFNSTNYVSLGKLLMIYLARPLASTKNFKEVQLLFYPFNANASNMYQYSTASFPIKKQEFVDALARETRLTANLPLSRFSMMLNRNFVSNQASEAYGFSNLYGPADEHGRRQLAAQFEGQQANLIGAKQTLLKYIYGGDAEAEAVFNLPSLVIYPESVHVKRISGDPSEQDLFDTILKLHIFDQRATKHETAIQFYQAVVGGKLNAVRRSTRRSNQMGHVQSAENGLRTALESGLVRFPNVQNEDIDLTAEIPQTFQVQGGMAGIKNLMRKIAPTIRFGSQGSAATKINFQSISDPLLNTVHILRANDGREVPPGSQDGGLPLRIAPTSVSMTTFGYPWFHYGQQFFIDFDTGTTADNLYAINSVSHQIAPGSFSTTVNMTPLSDAWGTYKALSDEIANAINVINNSLSDIE